MIFTLKAIITDIKVLVVCARITWKSSPDHDRHLGIDQSPKAGRRERIGVRLIDVLVYGNSSGIEPECLDKSRDIIPVVFWSIRITGVQR